MGKCALQIQLLLLKQRYANPIFYVKECKDLLQVKILPVCYFCSHTHTHKLIASYLHKVFSVVINQLCSSVSTNCVPVFNTVRWKSFQSEAYQTPKNYYLQLF